METPFLQFESSLVSQSLKSKKSISLRERISPGRLSPILSASCAGWAALDDVRNWVVGTLLERPARQLLSAGLATEVRL